MLLWALVAAAPAGATVIETTATPFTGDPIEVRITFDDEGAGDGEIWIGVEVAGGYEGDLRGLFLNLADDSLLAGLEVTGPDVTRVRKGSLLNLGHGSNLNGGGTPCPCDLGIEFGSPGIGADDIASTWVVLSYEGVDLDVSLFSEQLVGVRVTSVGTDGRRNGSSKTVAMVPEPHTAGLVSLGLVALARLRRRGAGLTA